tara:strand:- start:470 stop:646 length:177 start_codon:yes stop_codon:yes gene_type:complete
MYDFVVGFLEQGVERYKMEGGPVEEWTKGLEEVQKMTPEQLGQLLSTPSTPTSSVAEA